MTGVLKVLLLLLSGLIARPLLSQVGINVKNSAVAKQKFEQMDAAIRTKQYSNIHSVLVLHHDRIIYEKYYQGRDESWGDDIGIVNHAADSLHDMRSVTKSVVSICIGLAIRQGKIRSVNEKVMSFFSSLKIPDTGWRSELTIKHLLIMSSGMEWNENLPYTDTLNSEIRMSINRDPVSFILQQPIIEQPGLKWNYNGGNTQLLSAIIEKACGMPIDKFANAFLFQPLGIGKYFWYHMPENNIAAAASGLRLTSSDMLKIGELLLNNGVWKGKRLLDASWVDATLSNQIDRGDGGGYGYQFWIFKAPGTERQLPAAVGNGDQRIFIDRNKQLVVAITAGNYNQWNLKKASYELLEDFIYPAIR